MKNISKIKISLLVLSDCEPKSYDLEINEIFNCILENREYDEDPDLERLDLIDLLESLGHNLLIENPNQDLSAIEKLRRVTKPGTSMDKKVEEALRSKIRRILLGS